MQKSTALSARGGRAAGSARRARRPIDFSDIPAASGDQLQAMGRVGRPPLGDALRQLITIRLDASILRRFRQEAKPRRIGCQTLITEVLAARREGRGVGAPPDHRLRR